MAHLLNYSSIPNEINDSSSLGVPSTFWPHHDSTMNMSGLTDTSCISLECDSSRFNSFSEGSSYINGGSLTQKSYYVSDPQPILTPNNSSMSMDSSSYLIDGDDCMNQEISEGNAEESAGNMPEAVLPDKDLQLQKETEDPKPAEKSKKRYLGSGHASKIMLFVTFLPLCYIFPSDGSFSFFLMNKVAMGYMAFSYLHSIM